MAAPPGKHSGVRPRSGNYYHVSGRLELYFDANTVAAEKKVSALLYGIGPKVYGVL